MIPAPGLNALGPIELLQQHYPCQVVGEGHIGEGELQVGQGLDLRGDAEAGAQQEAGRGAAAGLDGGQGLSKGLGPYP